MFNIDKNLNYGRHNISHLVSGLSNVDSALDVGAGRGSDLEIVRNFHPNAKLYGIEFYESYAAELEKRNISTFRIDFEREKLPVEDEELNLIISNQMMEHSKDVFWVLHEMTRSLKVGGHLLIGVPNLASLHNRLLLLLGKQPTCIQNHSAHIRGYTKEDLIQLVNIFNGGFDVVDFKGSNFYPFSHWLAKPLANLFPTIAYSIFILFKKTKEYNGEYLKHPVQKQLETKFYLGEECEEINY